MVGLVLSYVCRSPITHLGDIEMRWHYITPLLGWIWRKYLSCWSLSFISKKVKPILNLLHLLEAPKWQHLLFLSWYVQILLHNYLDLATFNTKDLMLLITWPRRKSLGKYELVRTHNGCFSETMHYWPTSDYPWRFVFLVHFYVTERFSIDKCLSIACIFYGKIIAYPLHIIFQSCCMCSNCSKEWKVNMVKILPSNHKLN